VSHPYYVATSRYSILSIACITETLDRRSLDVTVMAVSARTSRHGGGEFERTTTVRFFRCRRLSSCWRGRLRSWVGGAKEGGKLASLCLAGLYDSSEAPLPRTASSASLQTFKLCFTCRRLRSLASIRDPIRQQLELIVHPRAHISFTRPDTGPHKFRGLPLRLLQYKSSLEISYRFGLETRQS
jgi:hypothetical protein